MHLLRKEYILITYLFVESLLANYFIFISLYNTDIQLMKQLTGKNILYKSVYKLVIRIIVYEYDLVQN